VREDGEELVKELLWDAAVTGKHRVADVGRRSWLTAASIEWGDGLAAVLSGEEAEEAKCGHARR
jgi:hypothetical protein